MFRIELGSLLLTPFQPKYLDFYDKAWYNLYWKQPLNICIKVTILIWPQYLSQLIQLLYLMMIFMIYFSLKYRYTYLYKLPNLSFNHSSYFEIFHFGKWILFYQRLKDKVKIRSNQGQYSAYKTFTLHNWKITDHFLFSSISLYLRVQLELISLNCFFKNYQRLYLRV